MDWKRVLISLSARILLNRASDSRAFTVVPTASPNPRRGAIYCSLAMGRRDVGNTRFKAVSEQPRDHLSALTIRKSPSFVHPSSTTSLATTILALPVPALLTRIWVALPSDPQLEAVPADGLESTRQKPDRPKSGSTYFVTK